MVWMSVWVIVYTSTSHLLMTREFHNRMCQSLFNQSLVCTVRMFPGLVFFCSMIFLVLQNSHVQQVFMKYLPCASSVLGARNQLDRWFSWNLHCSTTFCDDWNVPFMNCTCQWPPVVSDHGALEMWLVWLRTFILKLIYLSCNSLAVQWLGLCPSTGGMGSILVGGIKSLPAAWLSQKKKKKGFRLV